ncbi:Lysine-specific demethylase 3B, partial [Coemansia sp. RSA 2703]
YAQPDLRPEIQFTYGICETGSPDNLRCDASDMINLLLYSSTTAETQASLDVAQVQTQFGNAKKPSTRRSGKKADTNTIDDDAAVQWIVFPPGASEYLRDFNNSDDNHDPIHDRNIYMDAKACRRLYESYDDEVKSYLIYQRPGDAVFIPAGSIYQRRTLRNTIAIQSRSLSPEHAAVARRVSDELSANKYRNRRSDTLPVMDILWWVWMGNSEEREGCADSVICSAEDDCKAKESNCTSIKISKNA